jgi:hypothetical protein
LIRSRSEFECSSSCPLNHELSSVNEELALAPAVRTVQYEWDGLLYCIADDAVLLHARGRSRARVLEFLNGRNNAT